MKWLPVVGLILMIGLVVGGTVYYVARKHNGDVRMEESPRLGEQSPEASNPEPPTDGSAAGADGAFCTQEYDPVCGVDGMTYGNRCVATQQAQVEVAYEGECQSEVNQSPSQDQDSEIVVCPELYEPVCGKDGQTYGNRCVATQQAQVEVAYEGMCK